jgi:hypothetical protein
MERGSRLAAPLGRMLRRWRFACRFRFAYCLPLAFALLSVIGCDNSPSKGTDAGDGAASKGADVEAADGSVRPCPALSATGSPDIDLSRLPTCDGSNQGQICPGFERVAVCVDGFWLECHGFSPWPQGCYADGRRVDTCNNKGLSYQTLGPDFGSLIFAWCQSGAALPPGTLCCQDPDASVVGWVATPDAGCSGTCSPSCVDYHLTYPDTCPRGDPGDAGALDAGSDSATDALADAMDSPRE